MFSCKVVLSTQQDDGTFSPRQHLTTYREQYTKQSGEEREDGARNSISSFNAKYGYGGLKIPCSFRVGDDEYQYGSMYMSAKYLSAPSLEKFPSNLHEHRCRQGGLHVEGDLEYKSAYYMTFNIHGQNIRYLLDQHVVAQLERLNPPGYKEACDSTAANLRLHGKVVRIEVFLPLHQDRPIQLAVDFDALVQKSEVDPYLRLWEKVPPLETFRTQADMLSVLDCNFKDPDNPVPFFVDVRERAVRLSYGARDEFAYLDAINALCERRPARAVALPLPNHKIRGINTGWLITLISPEHLELLPNVSEVCKLRVDVPCVATKPQGNKSPEQTMSILKNRIIEVLDIARDKAPGDYTMQASYVGTELHAICKPSNDSGRAAFITRNATDLLPKTAEHESKKDHDGRVKSWTREMFTRGLIRIPPKTSPCSELSAVRVTAPAWLADLGGIVFYARSHPIGTSPKDVSPEDIKFPTIPIEATVDDTIAGLRRLINNKTFECKIIRTTHGGLLKANLGALAEATRDQAEQSHQHFDVFSRYLTKVQGPSIKHDLAKCFPGIANLRGYISGFPIEQCMDGLPNPIVLNGHERAQAVQEYREQMRLLSEAYNQLDADQQQVFTACDDPTFGLMLISGCPGSGKNHTMETLITTAWSAGVDDTEISKLHNPIDMPHSSSRGPGEVNIHGLVCKTPEDYVRPRKRVPHSRQSGAQQAHRQSQPKTYPKLQVLIIGSANVQLDKIAESLEAKCSALGQERKIVRALSASKATAEIIRHMEPESPQTFDDAEEVDDVLQTLMKLESLRLEYQAKFSKPKIHGGHFAISQWAKRRIEAARPEDMLVHKILELERKRQVGEHRFYSEPVREYRRELKKLIVEEYNSADAILATPEVAYYLSGMDDLELNIQLIWVDEVYRMTEPDTMIAFSCFPNAVGRFLTGDDKQCDPLVKSMDQHRSKSEDLPSCNQFGNQLRTSLARRLETCGHRTIYLKINWRARGGISSLPSGLFYDDNMVEGHNVDDINPEQQRIITFFNQLSGSAASEPATSGGPILTVNIAGDNQRKAGTSIVNEANAKAIRELVANIFENNLCRTNSDAESNTEGLRVHILVICFYKEQALYVQRLLSELSAAEALMSLVKVQTVQEAQGNEADIVIVDYSRTSGLGYIGNARLLNVAITRAKLGMVIVQNRQAWQHRNAKVPNAGVRNLSRVDEWTLSRDATVEVGEDVWAGAQCLRCFKHHSHQTTCAAVLKCRLCEEDDDHHIRNCGKGSRPQNALRESVAASTDMTMTVEFESSRIGSHQQVESGASGASEPL